MVYNEFIYSRMRLPLYLSFGAWLCLVSCSTDDENPLRNLTEDGEEMSGGGATVYDESVNAFGHAAPNLISDKELLFVVSNAFFKRNWVTAPASTEDVIGKPQKYLPVRAGSQRLDVLRVTFPKW